MSKEENLTRSKEENPTRSSDIVLVGFQVRVIGELVRGVDQEVQVRFGVKDQRTKAVFQTTVREAYELARQITLAASKAQRV